MIHIDKDEHIAEIGGDMDMIIAEVLAVVAEIAANVSKESRTPFSEAVESVFGELKRLAADNIDNICAMLGVED